MTINLNFAENAKGFSFCFVQNSTIVDDIPITILYEKFEIFSNIFQIIS